MVLANVFGQFDQCAKSACMAERVCKRLMVAGRVGGGDCFKRRAWFYGHAQRNKKSRWKLTCQRLFNNPGRVIIYAF